MIKMKSLKSFGIPGVNEGKVRRGREMDVASEHRARYLEGHGLAYRIEMTAQPQRLDAPRSNKAAEAGPLDSAGGMTGEAETAPSSRQAPRPPQHRSSRYKAASES
jgi:hypothetical protein